MKKKLYFCSRKNNIYYMPVSKKSYDSDPQPSLMAAEPTASSIQQMAEKQKG